MFFPLVPVRFNKPPIIPGRPLYRDMPIVRLSIRYGNKTFPGWAHVDSMSDFVLLPDSVATTLQIDLTSAPTHVITVVGGSQVKVRFAEVTLHLRHPLGGVRWPATIAFGPTQRWIFGHFGGLEFFHFALDAVNEEMLLVPRDNLPPLP